MGAETTRPHGGHLGVHVLGPVRVVGPTGQPATRSPLLRTLLALLACERGQVTGTDRLIDELWGDRLPERPRQALQVQVTRLRSWLRDAGWDGDLVRHAHSGYVLDLEPEAIDLERFSAATRRARDAAGAGDPGATLRACDDAAREWQEAPFEGCSPGPVLEAEAERLREEWLQTAERRAAALLALDRPDDALVDLTSLRRRHPSRERLTELTMLALSRAGRQRDALAAMTETRSHLASLGLMPGPGLVRTEAAVLAQSPDVGPAPVIEPAGDPPVPDRPLIVGRSPELEVVADAVAGTDTGRLIVVTGEAGAGKTTLVRAAVHDAATAGVTVGIGDCSEGSPLSGFRTGLAALGVSPEILADDQRVRAVRAALAGRAGERGTLLVLEDLHDGDGATHGLLRGIGRDPLPPGVVVVCTARVPDARDHPSWASVEADLVRRPGTHPMRLDDLGRSDTTSLVATRLAHLDETDVAVVADELWRRTRGHPLHLASLLDLMGDARSAEECLDLTGTVSDRLRPLLVHQIDSLPADTRVAVDVLAVTGPIRLEDLAVLCDADPASLARSLRAAVTLGVVVDHDGLLALRHALTATVVLEEQGPTAVRATHLRRLEELRALGGDPFSTLHHGRSAGGLVAPPVLAELEVRAGRAAYAQGAFDEAAGLLRAAVDRLEGTDQTSTPDDDLLRTARLHLGLTGAARGDEWADDMLDAVVEDPRADEEDVALAAVGHELLGLRAAGDPRRLARLERAREVCRGVSDRRRLDILRALSVEQQLHAGTEPSAEVLTELDELSRRSEEAEDPVQRARALTFLAARAVELPLAASERLRLTRRAQQATVESRDPLLVLEGLELTLAATLAAGLPDEADDLRWALAREAGRTARPRSRWAASLVGAALALARGDAAEGDRAAEEALGLGLELGIPDAAGAFGVHLVAAGLLRGDLSGVAPLIDQAVEAYPHVAAWPAAAAVARAQALGGPDADCDPGRAGRAAVAELLGAYVERRRAQVVLAFDRPGLCLAAAAAWALGDHPRAVEVAGIVVEDLPPDPEAVVVVGVGAATLGPVELYRAFALAALGRDSEARDAVAAASQLADRLGWAPWRDTADALTGSLYASGDGWVGRRSPPPRTVTRPTPRPFGLAGGPSSRSQGGSPGRGER